MAIAHGTNLAETINLYNGATNSADTIFGLGGHDLIFAGGGDDLIKGGGGADHINGGTGIDTAGYTLSKEGVSISLSGTPGFGGEAAGDVLTNVENLAGSAYADQLWGNDGPNELSGIQGADILKGYGGDDRLFGGPDHDTLHGMQGADLLDGEEGADTMFGGLDGDTYIVDNAGDVVIEFGGQGIDTVLVHGSYTLPEGADVETLSTYDPNLRALVTLIGNSSGNVVIGNVSSNVLGGGGGNDQLIGSFGDDTFLFNTPLNAATNVDTIVDFDVAEDTLALDRTIFSNLAQLPDFADLMSTHFVVGSAAQNPYHRIIYDDNSGALFYDADGVGGAAAIQFAQLNPGLALESHHFSLWW